MCPLSAIYLGQLCSKSGLDSRVISRSHNSHVISWIQLLWKVTRCGKQDCLGHSCVMCEQQLVVEMFANLRRRRQNMKESEIVNSGQEVSLPTQDEGDELVTTFVMWTWFWMKTKSKTETENFSWQLFLFVWNFQTKEKNNQMWWSTVWRGYFKSFLNCINRTISYCIVIYTVTVKFTHTVCSDMAIEDFARVAHP